jgi:hypothetical protein
MKCPTAAGVSQPPARLGRTATALTRVSVVAAFGVVAFGVLVVGGTGCDEQAPVPRLYTVSPQRVYSDRPQRLRLVGSELVPRYDLDLSSGSRHGDAGGFTGFVGSGAAAITLRDFVFVEPSVLEATLDPGLGAGVHDVVVIDPRGARAVLSSRFVSLGPDDSPPRLSFIAPDELAPGIVVSARASIEDDDGLASVAWDVHGTRGPAQRGTCPELATAGVGATRIVCDVTFVVPPELGAGESFVMLLTAVDGAPSLNRATLSRSFSLRASLGLTSVSPTVGGAAGDSDVVVRGNGFGPGTRIWFGNALLAPDGGLLLDERTIVGKTPPQNPGPVVVRAVTAIDDARGRWREEGKLPGSFEYLAPPELTAIEPARGPSAGASAVVVRGHGFSPTTRVYLGSHLATALPLQQLRYVDATEIRGITPAGQGSATVFAIDPAAGWAQLPAGFTWEGQP